MTRLSPDMPLVGRANIVSLVEELIERDRRRRLPVITIYGPGGSGKTAAITHLHRYFDANTLQAMVRLEQDKSKRPEDVLDRLATGLCQDSHRHEAKLKLPRYEIARILRDTAAETTTDLEGNKLIRRRLAERLSTLFQVGEAVRQGGEASSGIGAFLGRMFRPLSQWLYGAAIVAPHPVRRLLTRPKYAAALRWYERPGSWRPTTLPDHVRVDDVGIQLHNLLNADPNDTHARESFHRIMVAALLADLRSEFRWRRSHKLNCLLLLDNADLLTHDDAEMWAVKGAPAAPRRGKDLLDLIADEMREHPKTPLLTVATKQAGPGSDGFDEADYSVESADGEPVTGDRDRHEARKRYQVWRDRPRKDGSRRRDYLPVPLAPLTLEQTHQVLDQLSEIGEHTVREDTGVREIFNATHGHPLAIHLVAKKLSRHTKSPVRKTFELPASPDADTDGSEDVRQHLLNRFLQRFRNESASIDDEAADGAHGDAPEEDSGRAVRRETTELLARLAAPLTLTDGVVDLLTTDHAQEDRDRFKEQLPNLSFATPQGDARFSLHPLLRDLLVGELAGNQAGQGFSHDDLHAKLIEHYAASVGHEAQVAMHYHLLATGNRDAVAGFFGARVRNGRADDRWLSDMDQVCRAPMPVNGTARQFRQWLKFRATSDPQAPQYGELIERLWSLRSCTARQRWDRGSLNALDRLLPPNASARPQGWPGTGRVRLAEVSPNLRSAPPYPYPRVWLTSRRLRRSVAVTVVMALVGYGAAFGLHAAQHCSRGGFDPLEPVRAVRNDTMMLTRLADGQCIGLATGVGNFSTDGVNGPDEREIVELTRLIYKQNQMVEQHHEQRGIPYVTVVVATIASTTQRPPRHGLSVGVNELRGAYLAQRQWNGFHLGAGLPDFLVRIVIANFGGQSEHAADVAEDIRELVRRDPTVVGVTGLGQTRSAVVQAVGLLGPDDDGSWPGVAMVASALSGDVFSGKPYFFRVAVPNSRQAEVGAKFLTSLENIRARKPFLLYDPTDTYSAELADSYDEILSDLDRLFLVDPVHLKYEAVSQHLSSTLLRHMNTMCRKSRRVDQMPLLIYTGRANEAFSVLKSLDATVCAVNTLILGGDDLAQLEMSDSSYLLRLRRFGNGQLLFTSFGTSKKGWERVDPPFGTWKAQVDFSFGYQRMMKLQERSGGDAYRSPSNGHVVAAYDALGLLIDAVKRAGRYGGSIHDREAIYRKLRATTGRHAYYGASGVIDFGAVAGATEHSGADPVRKFVSIQRVVGLGGDLRTEHVTAYGVRRENDVP